MSKFLLAIMLGLIFVVPLYSQPLMCADLFHHDEDAVQKQISMAVKNEYQYAQALELRNKDHARVESVTLKPRSLDQEQFDLEKLIQQEQFGASPMSNEMMLKWSEAKLPHPFEKSDAGPIMISVQEALSLFRNRVNNESMQEFLPFIVANLMDAHKVNQWFITLRNEILQAMWSDGVPLENFKRNSLREFYVDKILAKRAKTLGYQVQQDATPFDLLVVDEDYFFSTLAKRRVFVDWVGYFLQAQNASHLSRGHLMQMVYMAENIVNFPQFIEWIGKTKDHDKVWLSLFDNPLAGMSPFSSGYWVMRSRDFLVIRK